jgi:5,6,7,8-tetrahydromethanopterin hydro-lyase
VFAAPTLFGESFVGSGPEAAHTNVVLGRRGSPVEAAWAGSLAAPRQGHVPFVAVLQPGLPVRPLTLFVNKAEIATERHGMLTWGAAQAGLAAGVARAVSEGLVPRGDAEDLLLIAAVWIDPSAADEELVFANQRDAALGALRAAVRGEPRIDAVLAAADEPRNPFFRLAPA